MTDATHTPESVQKLKDNVKLNYRFIDQIKFGRQHPQSKDFKMPETKFQVKFHTEPLPEKVNLSSLIKDVYDQQNIGSCVSNSVAMAYRMTLAVYNAKTSFHKYAWYYKDLKPSRLFLYFYTRLLEDIPPSEDVGSSILSGYRAVIEHGVVDEQYWPYDTKMFSQLPPANVLQRAEDNVTPGYHKVKNTLQELKHALANKQPVSFGAVLFQSFFTAQVANTGSVPVPKKVNKDVCGGHALLLVGYDDSKKVFYVKNSWSEKWGRDGICEFPYDYITDPDLCADFWCFVRL